MKRMDIKEFEITKKMYNRAKEVENLFEITKKLDCRSEKFKKLSNKWIELDEKFEEEVSNEFGTLEIVNEYERRERNAKKNLKTVDEKKIEDEKMKRKKVAWIINLMNIGVLSFLVVKNYAPLYGAVACTIAVLTILIATIPEALTLGIVYNDDIE